MTVDWNAWTGAIGLAATAAFAATAVLAIARDSEIDLFGAVVLGLITATAGGTIRDLILGVPVFWAQEVVYVWVATGAALAAFYGRKLLAVRLRGGGQLYRAMLYLDGFGAALFGIQAAEKVWQLGFGLPVGPAILAVITAIGGGLLRDVLAGRQTLIMRPELYATPVLLGCIAFQAVLAHAPEHRVAGSIACIVATFAVRAAAIRWDLAMPAFARLPKR